MANRKKRSQSYKELSDKLNKQNSMLNKRARRLEKANMTSSPAYKKLQKTGGRLHNSKDMTYNEMHREYQRGLNFKNSKTSTKRGIKKVMKQTLANTGLEDLYIGRADVKSGPDGTANVVENFFSLTNLVDEYLKNTRGRVLNYQDIWKSIINVTQTKSVDLGNTNPEELLADVVKKLHNDYIAENKPNPEYNTFI